MAVINFDIIIPKHSWLYNRRIRGILYPQPDGSSQGLWNDSSDHELYNISLTCSPLLHFLHSSIFIYPCIFGAGTSKSLHESLATYLIGSQFSVTNNSMSAPFEEDTSYKSSMRPSDMNGQVHKNQAMP